MRIKIDDDHAVKTTNRTMRKSQINSYNIRFIYAVVVEPSEFAGLMVVIDDEVPIRPKRVHVC